MEYTKFNRTFHYIEGNFIIVLIQLIKNLIGLFDFLILSYPRIRIVNKP